MQLYIADNKNNTSFSQWPIFIQKLFQPMCDIGRKH